MAKHIRLVLQKKPSTSYENILKNLSGFFFVFFLFFLSPRISWKASFSFLSFLLASHSFLVFFYLSFFFKENATDRHLKFGKENKEPTEKQESEEDIKKVKNQRKRKKKSNKMEISFKERK